MLTRIFRQLLEHYGPQHWWPGETPFEVMVGAVLTQNTAWTHAERAIENLRRADRLNPQAIASLERPVLAEYLRPAGYFNIKAKRLQSLTRFLLEHPHLDSLATPDLRQQLLAVHGIGAETADAILLYAYQRPVFVVDAYMRRIFGRMGFVDGSAGYEVIRQYFESSLGLNVAMFNEYHALIVQHAKVACRSKPSCESCAVRQWCRDFSRRDR